MKGLNEASHGFRLGPGGQMRGGGGGSEAEGTESKGGPDGRGAQPADPSGPFKTGAPRARRLSSLITQGPTCRKQTSK